MGEKIVNALAMTIMTIIIIGVVLDIAGVK